MKSAGGLHSSSAASGGMEKYARQYRNGGYDLSKDGEKKEPADVGDDTKGGSDPAAGSDAGGMDYRRLIDEQRFELEQLKRAARDASPRSSSRLPPPRKASSAAADVTAIAVPPPAEFSDSEPRLLPPPPPASNPRPHLVDGIIYGTPGGGNSKDSRHSLEIMAAGGGGDYHWGGTTEVAPRHPGGAGGDGAGRYSSGGGFGNFLAAVTRETRTNQAGGGGNDTSLGVRTTGTAGVAPEAPRGGSGEGATPLAPTAAGINSVRFERPSGGSGESATAGEVLEARGNSGDGGDLEGEGALIGPSAIADEALASLEGGHGSAGGGAVGGSDGAERRTPHQLSLTPKTSMLTDLSTADGIRPASSGDGVVGSDAGSATDNNAGRNGDFTTDRLYSGESDASPTPLKVAPTAIKSRPLPPSSAADYVRRPSAHFHAESAEAISDSGYDGRDAAIDSPAGYRRDAKHAGTTRLTDQRGGREKVLGSRTFVGSSWMPSGGGWGANGGLYQGELGTGERRESGGDAFRSASWADRLVVKREEQSVLVTQLERELASTVSALKDERKERRDQTEMLKRKLDKATGTLGDREAELERRERMTTTLMAELEALRSRCDRLSASREERAEEADKMMTRLREDNREFEARLRQADAAAAEAREARAGADAERVRMERDLHAALAKATAAERRAEDVAEASTAAAEVATRELRESTAECERLRSELERLRKCLEEEESASVVGSLRAQVADLERLLSTANQRCVALEARLGLLERELVEAEGGEVEARARLRWALGQLGETLPAADAAGAAAGGAGDAENTSSAANFSSGLHRSGNTAAAAAAAESSSEGMARKETRKSGRSHVGELERPRGHAVVPKDASGDTLDPRRTTAAVASPTPPTAESPPRQGLSSSPSTSAARLTRGSLATPPFSPGKAFDGDLDDARSFADSPGGDGGDEVRETEQEREEEEEEEEFREPNWRSMVPVLFPPGWRDREISAAAATEARGAERGVGAAAAVDDGGMSVTVSVERSVGDLRAGHVSEWDGRRLDMADSEDDDSSDDARDQIERERGVVVREEEADVSHAGSVATAGVARGGTGWRQWAAEGEEGLGQAMPPVDDNDNGAYYETSEGRVQAALDHLTAEEERFAFRGGVDTEYGRWHHGESDGLGDEYGSESGDRYEESRRARRYEYDSAPDYHDDGGDDDGDEIASPVPERGGRVGALGRASRKGFHRIPIARAGERRRRAPSPKATPGRPRVSSQGALRAGAPSRQIGVRGDREGANIGTIASATGRRRPQCGRLSEQLSAGENSIGGQGRLEESHASAGKRRGTGAQIASAAADGEMTRGITRRRRRLSPNVPVPVSRAASKPAPTTSAGWPPSHPRSAAGAGATVHRPRRRNQSDSPGVEVRRAVVRRPGSSAGNGRGRGSPGARRLDPDVSLGSASAKPRAGRGVLARSTPGADAGRPVGDGNGSAGFGRGGVSARREKRDDGHRHVSARGSLVRPRDSAGTNGGTARRAPRLAAKAEAGGGPDLGMSTSYVSAGARSARGCVSLMRRRKERGGLGSGSATRAGAGGGGERRVGRRGAGGSSGGTADSSICSSRAWKP